MIRIVKHDLIANQRELSKNVPIGYAFGSTIVETPNFCVTSVRFENGARNSFHTHLTEQLLIVTSGQGLVVTEEEELEISEGDVAFIPPHTLHWHGAKPGSSMTHLAIWLPGELEPDELTL